MLVKFACTVTYYRVKMVQAWYMDSSNEDQRLPHHMEPPQFVSLDELKKWGVLYWKVSLLKVMRNCTTSTNVTIF